MGEAWRERMDAGMSSNFQSPYLPIPKANEPVLRKF